MLELPHTLIAFAVVLGVLVFFHELGHYLAARWAGVKVEAFSIGFGPKLLAWTDRAGTEWRLCLLPLGGYVKMHGMEQPADVPEEVRAGWIPGQTFQGKSVGQRAVVVAAGPVANFLLAIVLFAGLFAVVGRPYSQASVQEVVVGAPAARAGLRGGDLITAIDGKPVLKFDDLHALVAGAQGKPLQFSVKRKDRILNFTITPELNNGVAQIGIMGGSLAYEHLGPLAAMGAAVQNTYQIARDDLVGIGRIFSGADSASNLSGVVGIAQMSGAAARSGLPNLINFIAFLSVNLGLINLFPIPVLDGGHLMFFAAEAVRGKPLSPRVQGWALYFGLAVIALLLIVSNGNDLLRSGMFHWLARLF